jgi:hypothetical protein
MEQIFTDMGPQDAAGLRAWLMGLIQGQNLDGGQYGQQGHWNYYGDNATRFEQTTVTGYAPLTNTSIPANDPLLGATVSIVGNTYLGQDRSRDCRCRPVCAGDQPDFQLRNSGDGHGWNGVDQRNRRLAGVFVFHL